MQFINRVFSYLISPAAIGCYLTFCFTVGALSYYAYRDYDEKNVFLTALEFFHQKTIDYRLIARGPRKGSPRVAILDIDDKSVQLIGRWPWPRKAHARLINEVMKYKPSVISFDVAYPEVQQNPVADSLNRLRQNITLDTPEINEFIDREILDQNQDTKLAETVETYADNLVMGSFFDNEEFYFRYPHQFKCKSVAYSLTRGAEVFENEENGPLVLIADDLDLPEPMIDLMIEKFEKVGEEVTETYLEKNSLDSMTKATQAQRDILENLIYRKIADSYCKKFLIAEGEDKDPYWQDYEAIWADIIEDDEDRYQGLSFADGMTVIRESGLLNPVQGAEKFWFNIPKIAEVTKHNGFFVANQDSDGTIRTAHLLSRIGSASDYLLPISFKAYLVATQNSVQFELGKNQSYRIYNRIRKTKVSDADGNVLFEIPTDSKGNIRINYAGPRYMFPYISAAEFLNGKETAEITERVYDEKEQKWGVPKKPKIVNKAEFVKDKIFLFGPSATGIFDLRVTPFEENYPGVETHANVLDNILRQDFLRNLPKEQDTMILLLLITGFVLSVLIGILGALSGLLVTAGTIASFIAIDYSYFFLNGIVTTIIFPVSLIFTLYVGLTFYKYLTEERKKKELKGTFSKYVSPAIVEEILKDPSNIELGGKKQRITVFFSDIRGFTTISEKLDPQALSDLLNSYLTPMTELVFENKGTLDKYMGDAIMAFFGAPISFDDHPKYACRCALAHLVKLGELQKEYEAQGLPLLDIGIGLNTGDCSVGNMGSNTVRSYTVMGDAVNLGARLEGINKQYGTRIIISEFTYADVKDSFTCREVDWVKVKGKIEPVRIFELVSEGEPEDPKKSEMLGFFNAGFDLYHERKFSEALQCFNSSLEAQPDDLCSKLYIDRCQGYIDSSPPQDWDGVFVMTTK